jgi:hypothetical protein
MTGDEIIQLASDIAEDDIPTNLAVNFLNVCKNRREEMRPWQMLKKLDQSKTASVGDTYLTSKALPSDFRFDYKMMVGTDLEYLPVPFEQQHIYKDAARRYFIDFANSSYYLTGRVGTSSTIYLFYIKTTTDYTEATTGQSLLVWPERFQPLIAFDMAAMYQGGVDYDDVSARMSPENKAAARAIELSMIQWDDNLIRRAMNNSYTGYDQSPDFPLSMM